MTAHRRFRIAALALATPLLMTTPAAPTTPSEPDVAATVEAMSVDELIGQMTWVHVSGAAADDASRAADNRAHYGVDTPAQVVEKYHLRSEERRGGKQR